MNNIFQDTTLYAQETEFKIIQCLAPYLSAKIFIDIGAEKGKFACFLFQQGFRGVLFEPCPKHHVLLEELTRHSQAKFFPYAIDAQDRQAKFYINCTEDNEPTDYFHSLQPLVNDQRVHHRKSIQVSCRSLQSLSKEGIIERNIGILKIDTEGNDLQVLQGIGELQPEVIICEFFTEGLFSGWKQGDPHGLITKAKELGFIQYVVVKRSADRELVSFSPAVFCEKQWGNLLFLNEKLYRQAFQELQEFVILSEQRLLTTKINQELQRPQVQNKADSFQYMTSLEDWLQVQMGNHALDLRGKIVVDVGAYHGDFSKQMLATLDFSKSILFEPHPETFALLLQTFSHDPRYILENSALSNHADNATLYCSGDFATASVLSYITQKNEDVKAIRQYVIQQTTLDRYSEKLDIFDNIGLIKIDSQGCDLNVLHGAEITIQKSQPWIVVELIFVPLYESQAFPESIYQWLSERRYVLAALFNEHYTEDNWLAFADAVFVPYQMVTDFYPQSHAKPEYAVLQNEVALLRQVGDERLALINFLHEEAEKRLQIIHCLERELKQEKNPLKFLNRILRKPFQKSLRDK